MRSTMQDDAAVDRHAGALRHHGPRSRRGGHLDRRRVPPATYAEVGARAARLAHALRGLGVTGDERVGTFMWNNQEHLEAYLAVPAWARCCTR